MEKSLLRLGDLSLRVSSCTCGATRSFSQTVSTRATSARAQRRHKDPYAIAQSKARKAASTSRQAELQKLRQEALGDPVRGLSTPFTKSFETGEQPAPPDARSKKIPHVSSESVVESSPAEAAETTETTPQDNLNYFMKPGELESSLKRSLLWSGKRRDLDAPYEEQQEALKNIMNPDPEVPTHITASEAMRRITSLNNGSSKDRLRVNIQHCISAFGRHNTDEHLPGKPAPSQTFVSMQLENHSRPPLVKTPRAGPDTGSSEVQIGILTARIKTLSEALGRKGRMDKHNKHNLRLLVHKRQKLLNYLNKKERGGPRFQNVVDVLGLQPAAWEGEISLR